MVANRVGLATSLRSWSLFTFYPLTCASLVLSPTLLTVRVSQAQPDVEYSGALREIRVAQMLRYICERRR